MISGFLITPELIDAQRRAPLDQVVAENVLVHSKQHAVGGGEGRGREGYGFHVEVVTARHEKGISALTSSGRSIEAVSEVVFTCPYGLHVGVEEFDGDAVEAETTPRVVRSKASGLGGGVGAVREVSHSPLCLTTLMALMCSMSPAD